MRQAKPRIRLFVPQPFRAGDAIDLGEGQSHYLLRVMRLDVEDSLLLFNGRDGEWEATLTVAGKKKATVTLNRQVRPQQSGPDLWLVFAPVKNKNEWVVEKAVELGVSRILPALARHSVVKSVNAEKLAAHAMEAAEQCERLDVPPIENCRPLPDILHDWPKDRWLLHADESGGGVPLGRLLPGLSGAAAVLIGPEGGFSQEERRMLAAKDYVKSFGMGPRILRSDTAAVAALACVQAWRGDWQEQPHFESAT